MFPEPRPNVVNLPGGISHVFPSDATPAEMQKALSGMGQMSQPQQSQPQQQLPPNLVDKLRPFISAGAGTLAGIGTTLIPGVGESGIANVAADTQSYALVDTLLKYLGANKPKSFTEALTGSEADAAVNAVAGKLMNGVFKGAKAFWAADQPEIYKLFPTTSQALERFGMKALATIPKFIEDYGVPEAKAAALDKSGGEGFTQALAHANTMNGRMAGTNSNPQKLYDAIKGQLQLGLEETPATQFKSATHYASQDALNLLEQGSDHLKVLDDVIGDPDKLSQVLKVGQIAGSPAMNVKQDLAAYKFMRMVQEATTTDLKGAVRIDPKRLATAWTDPEMQSSFNTLYGKAGMQRIGEFFKDIAYTQENQATNPALGKFLRYANTSGKFIIGMQLLRHGMTTGNFAPLGIATGVQIGASTMGRLLTNPTTARVVAEMAKGTLKENPTWAAKMIGSVLKNQTVGIVGSDGSVTEGSLENNPDTGTLEFQPNK